MDDKLYKPEVIQENPFPGEVVQPVSTSTPTNVADNYSPTVSKANQFPVKKRAVELLSTALNTRSRKILQNFLLQQSGGIQVGDFQEGLSGDIRITPNGITARDLAGLITFLLDATDGSAIFKGTLQAGSIIAGDGKIIMEEASNGNGRIVFYNDGIAAILIGDPS